MIAAFASAILMTINAIPAILGSNNRNVINDPQNTKDAPVSLFDSNERVIEWK